MCFGKVEAPEPIEIEKPVFVRNPFLDDEEQDARSAQALRRGRSSLVIPSKTGIGFEGGGGSVAAGAGGSGGIPGGSATTPGGSAGPAGIPRPGPGGPRTRNRGGGGGVSNNRVELR